ncbi:MAG: serine recombinase [Caloramator sp.]|uniref:Site-specific DNA recombinase n=1 Tax=Caloramator proteoclasticus DSM 10124 TaxID=1121262 RepID=A0A1M5AI25_9CLOT|nr:recombinase family protein [Caloramator proteoclasticus]GIW49031.1 MAG: serine recombinase [Caloramator sp.]SHF29795.1 Site-specific DNA recombinase [Caloramator proteoclasticus DSM 10124]
MARAVTVIPATANNVSPITKTKVNRKRVAAYARVSTDNEEQLQSFEAQMDYYTRHIKSNPDWIFVNVYTDEGISATSTKKRDGFNRMIEDALSGKIDLIITKSVSRFARNTVDTLTTVRKLKEKGVEVYFEKENIYTMDSKGELLITIMSSLAQEESRSISENVTWGQRKRFADGKFSLPYKNFLGYTKGEDGYPKIVEEEAKIVRLIYRMFLEGKTALSIAKYLTENKVPTPAGKGVWHQSTVLSILQNEKYKGDAVLQKKFTVDFLTKKIKRNEGEVPQYYVENSHPAIISPEVFALVQMELKNRKGARGYKTGSYYFSGKIICGDCGSFYGRKVWHSNDKYRKIIYQCNSKYKNEKKCKTPVINEEDLKKAFVEVFNRVISNKEEILKGYEEVIKEFTNTKDLDEKINGLERQAKEILNEINRCIRDNATKAQDQEEYMRRYNALVVSYENMRKAIEDAENKRFERLVKKDRIDEFIKVLIDRNELLDEFDEELWLGTVDSVVVNADGKITFVFKDGSEIE